MQYLVEAPLQPAITALSVLGLMQQAGDIWGYSASPFCRSSQALSGWTRTNGEQPYSGLIGYSNQCVEIFQR